MNDLISRQMAIDAIARMMPRSYTPDGSHPADKEIFLAQEVFADCIEALEILPSAQPDVPDTNVGDMISRQSAIDALEREKVYCTAFREGYAPTNAFEKYNAGLTDGIKALKGLPSAQGWIPCSDRLPDEDGLYIVSVINDRNRRYSKTCWYHGHEKWFARQDVVAWMPLPEPYGEDGET